MGNSGSGLPYEDAPECSPCAIRGTHWTVRPGNKIQVNERGEKPDVSIFRFDKSKTDIIPVAQRNWQKLRTMRHPYIVSVLDGIDMEKELVMVTERVVPLQEWLSAQSTMEEVVWGFKCILEALSFVHVTCGALHGYLGPHAVFVAMSGDWKLGGMDLACVLADEEAAFRSQEHRLDERYRSPERRDGSWAGLFGGAAGKPSSAVGAMDVFSLGVVFQEVCERLAASGSSAPPAGLDRIIQKMVSADFKKRPVCAQILRQGVFVSGGVALMSTLNELALKQPHECVEILQGLRESIALITKPVCSFKILPVVARALAMCVSDFQNRDARENCRQMIQTCTELLSGLISANKVDQASFTSYCLDAYVPLWAMTDRVVRTELLKTLRAFTEVLSADTINKKIFDNMLTGFSDTNAKMREDTLKNLVCVVGKLEERNLQEKIVRCMTSLQSDSEPSIRTNATIFLGRIAPDLKEPIRHRVLPGAFVKAMKDGFIHCRVAGVRAATACVNLIETSQLCGKVLPQVCILLLDPSQEVRELSMDFIQASMGPVKQNHQRMCRDHADAVRERDKRNQASAAASPAAAPVGGGGPAAAGGSAQVSADAGAPATKGWTSWAVDGLSKTIEQAVIVDQSPAATAEALSPLSSARAPSNPKGMQLQKVVPASPDLASPRAQHDRRSLNTFNPDSDEHLGSEAWGDSFEVEIDSERDITHSSSVLAPDSVEPSGWDDEDDWLDEDIKDPEPPMSLPRTSSNTVVRSTAKPAPPVKEKVSKVVKPVKSIGAKKMKVDKESENWDDF